MHETLVVEAGGVFEGNCRRSDTPLADAPEFNRSSNSTHLLECRLNGPPHRSKAHAPKATSNSAGGSGTEVALGMSEQAPGETNLKASQTYALHKSKAHAPKATSNSAGGSGTEVALTVMEPIKVPGLAKP